MEVLRPACRWTGQGPELIFYPVTLTLSKGDNIQLGTILELHEKGEHEDDHDKDD
ncbi:MAG: hypothetical protein IH802_11240 [Nitrospinae bacterium]|nr:hypothetical protein [Nitrospinota bacterium]